MSRKPDGLSAKKVKSDPLMDTGFQAWFLCFACFIILGTTSIVYSSYGIMLPYVQRDFSGHLASKTIFSLPGALCIGVAYFLSFFNTLAVKRFGLRKTTLIGAFVSAAGLLWSSFTVESPSRLNMFLFIVSFGIIVGAGFSLIVCPTFVILTHYFNRRLGFASGAAESGIYAFNTILPLFLNRFIDAYGLGLTLKAMTGLLILITPFILTFVERSEVILKVDESPEEKSSRSQGKKYWPRSLKNTHFVLWLIALMVALFGQFMTYVHLVNYSRLKLPDNNANILMSYIYGFSVIGRFGIGFLSDCQSLNVVTLQAFTILSTGLILTLYVVTKTYLMMVLLSCAFGLCVGGFFGIRLKVMIEMLGVQQTGESMGFVMGLYSLPFIGGPTAAGFLFDLSGSYSLPFLAASLECFLGALLLIPVSRYLNTKRSSVVNVVSPETANLGEEEKFMS